MSDNAYLSLLFNEPIFVVDNKNPNSSTTDYKIEGNTESDSLFIFEKQLSEPQIIFLDNVLKSIKKERKNIALIQNQIIVNEPLVNSFEKVVYFGINKNLVSFGIHDLYKPVFHKKTQLIMADSLGDIQNSSEKKKMFWEALQKMFL